MIIDAPPEVQSWVDGFILSAQNGTANFPHPHPDIPAATLSLAQLEDLVRQSLGTLPWGEAVAGGGTGGAIARPRPEHDDPTTGSAYHNLLHSMLGDFH